MKTLLFLSLLTAPLMGTVPTPETGSVSSTNASYDGSALVLTGHVVLDHGLGKMTAEEASLQRQEEAAKDFPFAVIQLKKEVLLALKNNTELRCENADLDFSALKGLLHAKENERVVYADSLKRKNVTTALKMLSKTVELTFSKQEHDGKKADYEVDTILAKNDVEITYADHFVLTADHALYRKQLPADNKLASKEFQGIITALPKDSTSQCHLTHEGDLIDADSIDLDLLHSKLAMLHPHGTLTSPKGPMHFRCDHLTWDNLKHSLLLKGNVEVQDPTFGTVTSQEVIELNHALVKGKRVLKSIHADGPTSLVYQDADHPGEHKIRSHGTIHLDRDKLLATLDSPLKEGKVSVDKQIYYEEKEIAFYADKASLEYAQQGDALQPVSLSLKGNILLFSHDSTQPFRCGVADRLNYALETRTLILSADPGKKVLFTDEAQGVKISAREVHITQDPETNQQTVKGVGNVQFALNAEENAQLKQIFPNLKVATNE